VEGSDELEDKEVRDSKRVGSGKVRAIWSRPFPSPNGGVLEESSTLAFYVFINVVLCFQ
jgi:hypothetical protein